MRGWNGKKVTSLKNAFILTEEKKFFLTMQHSRKLVRRLATFGIIALIILGAMMSAIQSQSASLKAKEQQLAETKQELVKLEQQQKRSEEELELLKDDEYIADIARKDYFLSNDGENIFNIPESDQEK